MAARKALIAKTDLTRYAKAMREAGYEEWRVVARTDGSHEIIAGKADTPAVGPDPDDLLS
jgi:hypothetical protein